MDMSTAENLAAKLVTDAARALAAQDGNGQTEAILRHYRTDARAVVIAVVVGLLAEREMRRHLNRWVSAKWTSEFF